jgi:c(7)-type cytochrome triheme protein
MRILLLGLACALIAPLAHADGKSTYEATCAGCHANAVLGAPRPGAAADWAPRLKRGIEALYRSALQGTAKGMPPKGGRSDLPDAEIRAAVDYMAQAAKPAPVQQKASPVTAAAEANAFNRLLRPPAKRNLPPAQDGIHDPALEGTRTLQAPLEAFAGWPRTGAGNRVDWVKALAEGKLTPRWDKSDPAAAPVVLDLNIVREVKGTMPDVVYPHKQHTEWLDCANCHPALFVPQKGANPISMAGILLGQACGACHGRVAFPVSECRACHSKKKAGP